jgi:hypothetical protein
LDKFENPLSQPKNNFITANNAIDILEVEIRVLVSETYQSCKTKKGFLGSGGKMRNKNEKETL